MSKFCQNCGKPMADDMRFCEACGAPYQAPVQQPQYQAPVQQPQYQAPVQQPQYQAPVQQPQYQQPQYQQPVYQQPVYQQPAAAPVATPAAAPKKSFDVNKTVNEVKKTANGMVNRAKKDKKFLGICIGAAAGVLAVIILLIVLLSGKPYASALNNEIKILTKGNGKLIEKTAPKAYWEYASDEWDFDMEDTIDDFNDEYEDSYEELEDYYGKNIKIKYEVTKEKDLSDNKLEDLADALEEMYEIDAKSVKAAKKLTIKFTIKGSDEEEKFKMQNIYAVKIGGKWYMMNSDGDFGIWEGIYYNAFNQIDD